MALPKKGNKPLSPEDRKKIKESEEEHRKDRTAGDVQSIDKLTKDFVLDPATKQMMKDRKLSKQATTEYIKKKEKGKKKDFPATNIKKEIKKAK